MKRELPHQRGNQSAHQISMRTKARCMNQQGNHHIGGAHGVQDDFGIAPGHLLDHALYLPE